MESVTITMSIQQKAYQVFYNLSHDVGYEFRKKDPVGHSALLKIMKSTEVDYQTYRDALHLLNVSSDSIWIRIEEMFEGLKHEFEEIFDIKSNGTDDLESQVYDLVHYIESTPYMSDKEVEIFWEGKKIYALSEKINRNKEEI